MSLRVFYLQSGRFRTKFSSWKNGFCVRAIYGPTTHLPIFFGIWPWCVLVGSLRHWLIFCSLADNLHDRWLSVVMGFDYPRSHCIGQWWIFHPRWAYVLIGCMDFYWDVLRRLWELERGVYYYFTGLWLLRESCIKRPITQMFLVEYASYLCHLAIGYFFWQNWGRAVRSGRQKMFAVAQFFGPGSFVFHVFFKWTFTFCCYFICTSRF